MNFSLTVQTDFKKQELKSDFMKATDKKGQINGRSTLKRIPSRTWGDTLSSPNEETVTKTNFDPETTENLLMKLMAPKEKKKNKVSVNDIKTFK